MSVFVGGDGVIHVLYATSDRIHEVDNPANFTWRTALVSISRTGQTWSEPQILPLGDHFAIHDIRTPTADASG
ncbi:MAG TPA: hypothetical protein VII32_08265, partial [Thermoanaerobaculia bacterium]